MPVGIIGLMYEKKIETLFTGNMTLVGSMLIVTSLLLFFTFFSKKDSDRSVSFKDAFIIGLAQALAIIPGISRSGATISTAILLKVNREEATRFSFIMVLVPIFGILLLKIYHGIINSELIVLKDNTIPYIIGFLSALISGILRRY